MKRITVYITEQQVASIQALVVQTGLKWAEVLRRLIDEALVQQATVREDTQPQSQKKALL